MNTYSPLRSIGAPLLVLGVLAVVGLAGHRHGWKVPKFSELLGSAGVEDDWCKEHDVPESICVECNPALMPRPKSSWCRVHGVHNCVFERPELAQTLSPSVTREDIDRAARALALKERKENS